MTIHKLDKYTNLKNALIKELQYYELGTNK